MCPKTENLIQGKCYVKNKTGKDHKKYVLYKLSKMAIWQILGHDLLEQKGMLCLIKRSLYTIQENSYL